VLRRLSPVLVVALLLVTGCGDDGPPRVRFGAGTATVQAGPTQYCDLEFTDCRNAAAAQVDVPDEIAETPWQVVFSYRDATGAQADGRSPVFGPNQRRDFALQLPTPTDRLLTAQVQQYGPPPQANPDTGEIEFPIRASWVLTAAAG
jgi:hypothetical protein